VTAAEACAQKEWASCLQALDEATVLDPAGDEAPQVQALRRAAEQGAGAVSPDR
jgi:hypothetical protein